MIATKPSTATASTLLVFGVAFLTALLSLPGCSILPERVPIAIYEPVPSEPVNHADWPKVTWSLLVARPVAGEQLDSERIAVRPSPGVLQVYEGSAWSDPAPDLVQRALLKRFQDAENILSVSRSGGGVRGQFQLLTDLRAFESVYAGQGQPQVVVELYARLVRTSDGQVVAARDFRETEASSDEKLGSVVDAFSRSLNRLTDQAVGWTLVSGNQSVATSAPGQVKK